MSAELPTHVIEKGCEVLYERIAEAFEPEYKELLARAFLRMQAELNRPLVAVQPTKPKPRNSIERRLMRLRGYP